MVIDRELGRCIVCSTCTAYFVIFPAQKAMRRCLASDRQVFFYDLSTALGPWHVSRGCVTSHVGGWEKPRARTISRRQTRAGGIRPRQKPLAFTIAIVAIFRSVTAPRPQCASAIMRPSHGYGRLLYTHQVLEPS